MADHLLDTRAAPGETVPGGSAIVYVDSTTKRLATKDDAQTVVNYAPLASPALITPNIGAAVGVGAALTGAITSSSPSAGIGYATGAGAVVVQATSRATGVTINAVSGQITGNATSLAAGAEAIFVVTNSACGLHDVPLLAVQSGPTANTSIFTVAAVAAGSFSIRIRNLHATVADTGAPILNFVIVKGVSA